MAKKYAVAPGYVKSKSDSDVHFVSAKSLINLYHVNPRDCIIMDTDAYFGDESSEAMRGYSKELLDSLVWLTPSYDGNYTLKGLA